MNALLDLKDCADALGTHEVAVKRLIARGRLAAAQLGNLFKFRITKGALDAYVEAGAPDFQMPGLDESADSRGLGTWFSAPLYNRTKDFESKMWAAILTTPASDAAIKAALAKVFKGDTAEKVDIEPAVNPAMRELIESPVPWPTGVFARGDIMGKAIDERIKDFRELYLVYFLRRAAREAVKFTMLESALSRLYASPDEYQANVAKALERTKSYKLLAREERVVVYEEEGRNALNEKIVVKREQRLTVYYVLPVGKLFEAGHDKRIPELAL